MTLLHVIFLRANHSSLQCPILNVGIVEVGCETTMQRKTMSKIDAIQNSYRNAWKICLIYIVS